MSSSDYAIRIKGIGKQYRLGIEQSGGMYKYKSLGDTVSSALRSPLKTLKNTVLQEPMNESNSFWALKDVSFDVKKGEVVGIIGRNGAGKSTLLKILSRITRPTTGEIELHGRVGSLLEVGTGFHPELSGRENIYLNGAVLGMTRAEVTKKFDEIVAFSEIEKFLDTPVKQYSSGMYTRLAFAVAAHLEPEILVVDEVLAVGDVEFQKKCLGKMEDVAGEGRTVLFVSHNLSHIVALCSKTVKLDFGTVRSFDVTASVVTEHLQGKKMASPSFEREKSASDQLGAGPIYLQRAWIEDDLGQPTSTLHVGQQLTFAFELSAASLREAVVGISVRSQFGQLLLHLSSKDENARVIPTSRPNRVTICSNPLAPGSYYVTFWIGDSMNRLSHRVADCLHFEVVKPGDREIVSEAPFLLASDWVQA